MVDGVEVRSGVRGPAWTNDIWTFGSSSEECVPDDTSMIMIAASGVRFAYPCTVGVHNGNYRPLLRILSYVQHASTI